jgi:D-3-phosphoglycerate dehydrogenase/(S)-sulfolactate dehydrogenase
LVTDRSGRSGRIVISEYLWEEGLAEVDHRFRISYDRTLFADVDRLRREVGSAEALIVRNQTRVDDALMRLGPTLRVVGRLGVGLDNIDVGAAHRRGVEVVYAPEANATSVAEFAVAAALALSRRLIPAHLHTVAGGWDRTSFSGGELSGKTAGIIGLGRIGELVAHRLKAFGLRLLAFDPRLSPTDLTVIENGITLVPWPDILAEVDLITLHLPLTAETVNLVGREELGRMRPTAMLVNTSRGGVLDEKALYEALTEGHIAGAALDVRRHEPPRTGVDPDFSRFDNVVLTPHIAGLTREADLKVTRTVLLDVQRVLRGEPPSFPASAATLSFPRPAKMNGG